MRIGIDGATWGNARGYGRFTRELVRAMVEIDQRHHYTLFLDQFTGKGNIPSGVGVVTVSTKQSPAQAASASGSRSLGDMWAFSRAIAAGPLDLIFFPSVYTYVPVLRPRRVVVGVHDVIAERFPQYVFGNARARLFWTMKTWLAIRQATRIMTVSEHARRGIQEHFRVAPRQVFVTGEAPAAAFKATADSAGVAGVFHRLGIDPATRVVVYFGGISPHKNIGMLVNVFAGLAQEPQFADVKLVIVGDYERDVFYSSYPALRAQVDATCRDTALFAGYLEDETLALLLNGAHVCVMPSLDEGFGLPGIEAAACGTAVIATRWSALPEILGNAAIYVDPAKPDELQAALRLVLSDEELRRTMSRQGRERARALTWTAAAQTVLQVFNELA